MIFTKDDGIPNPVNVKAETNIDLGEEIEFEPIDPSKSTDDAEPGSDPIADKIDDELRKSIDADLEEEDEDIETVEGEEVDDDGDDMIFELDDVAFIIDMIDEGRQSVYPKGFDKSFPIKKIKKFRRILGRKRTKTEEEARQYDLLDNYVEAYEEKRLNFTNKIPWNDSFKKRLAKWGHHKLKQLFGSTTAPALAVLAIKETILLGYILFAKSDMPDLDFEMPSDEKLDELLKDLA